MFFLYRKEQGMSPRPWGSSLMTSGLLCILFGIAIISAPELLAYIVAIFFILLGASLFVTGWRMRKW